MDIRYWDATRYLRHKKHQVISKYQKSSKANNPTMGTLMTVTIKLF